MTKHASTSPVTFVTHKRFAVLLRKITVGTLRSNDADGNENVKKPKG